MKSQRKTRIHQRAVEGEKHGRARSSQRPLPLTPASRALTFAQAVRNRYGARHERWTGAGFVYRHQRPARILQSIFHQTLLHWAPRLALTLITPVPHRPQRVETRSRPHQAPRQPDAFQGISHNPFLESPATYADEQRISLRRPVVITSPVLRRKSVESDARLSTVGTPRRLEPDIPPIPLVMHRQNQAVEVEGVVPVDSTVDGKHLGRKSPMDRADDRTTPIQPVDVRRLTDEVIHTIDRRIIAQRERLGRV